MMQPQPADDVAVASQKAELAASLKAKMEKHKLDLAAKVKDEKVSCEVKCC